MNLEQSNLGFGQEATELLARLPAQPAVVVIGSTSCWHGESAATCAAVGGLLASIEGLVLITGGMTGIGEGVGGAFSTPAEGRLVNRTCFTYCHAAARLGIWSS